MVTQSIVCGTALQLPFADKSVQCCITSPPYWGLREYGTATWEGGDPDCQHRVGSGVEDRLRKVVAKAGAGNTRAISTGVSVGCDASQCKLCGAKRIDAQLGLEKTPEEFVDNLVKVFAEVWRVLKDDGVLYLNLGDSYANKDMADGTRAKSLLGMPWRVAFGLQRFGWIHRCDITWFKPNPRPESVTDRPTKAHEYIFMMTKQPNYYWDAKAVREPSVTPAGTTFGKLTYVADGWRNIRSVWDIPIQANHEIHFATFPEKLAERCILSGSRIGDYVMDPFSGSGTVAVVAKRHGRGFVGTELNPEHIISANRRLSGTMNIPLDFSDEPVKQTSVAALDFS